jgi:chemotaxis protein CheD
MVGVGGLGVTAVPGGEVKTMALGSCVAVMLWDPIRRLAGMVHVAMPSSKIDRQRALTLPGYFADTGIMALVRGLEGHAWRGERLLVKLAGGAQVLDPNNVFAIGRRNIAAVRQLLDQAELQVTSEELGGNISRTVTLYVDDGRVLISTPEYRDRVI